MKNLVLIGFWIMMLLWLNSCAGTYKHIEVEYPPLSPYAKYKTISLEVVSPKDADKEEIKSFKELIISAFQKRGISVVDDIERPKLVVEIMELSKESVIKRGIKWALAIYIGGPWIQNTSNAVTVKVSMKDKGKVIEFKEFQKFKESIRDWEDFKKTVANRIADAVYFAY